MRLLWIDDEIDLLRPFVYTLRDRGYQVETATNGPDGLDLLRSQAFDLVLLDQMMAGMGGLETLRAIKELDSNIQVMMVTKSDDEGLVSEAYGEMVDDFLIKPFSPSQLLAVLKRLLEKRRLVAQRIGRQYLEAMNRPRDTSNWQGWVDYYRTLLRWQGALARYGDEALRDVQQDRWRDANDEFARFVVDRYAGWLAGAGPVLSHRVVEELVRPQWEQAPTCLLLLDAMRADQWNAIQDMLRDYYEIDTSYYCSILPTATPYARNAIFSGLLPLDIHRRYPQYWVFDESGQNRYERELLAELVGRLGLGARFEFVKVQPGDDLLKRQDVVLRRPARLTVVVLSLLDQLIHSVTGTRLLEEMIPDEAALVGATRVWFRSSPLFELLKRLARSDCRVVVTSDHGFIRVRRPTLIHGGRHMSANLRYKHGGALRIDERAALLVRHPERFMLPVEHDSSSFAIAKSDYYFIYPTKPREYERTYKHTYQHGGLSLSEMIVPVAVLSPGR